MKKLKIGWRRSYIDKILRNPAVIGEHQSHRMVEVEVDGKKKRKRVPVGDPIPFAESAIAKLKQKYNIKK